MHSRKDIEARLAALEQDLNPFTSYVVVQTADGREKEIPLSEFVQNWQEMTFIRAGKNFDLEALDAVLSIGWGAALEGGENEVNHNSN